MHEHRYFPLWNQKIECTKKINAQNEQMQNACAATFHSEIKFACMKKIPCTNAQN